MSYVVPSHITKDPESIWLHINPWLHPGRGDSCFLYHTSLGPCQTFSKLDCNILVCLVMLRLQELRVSTNTSNLKSSVTVTRLFLSNLRTIYCQPNIQQDILLLAEYKISLSEGNVPQLKKKGGGNKRHKSK